MEQVKPELSMQIWSLVGVRTLVHTYYGWLYTMFIYTYVVWLICWSASCNDDVVDDDRDDDDDDDDDDDPLWY